MTQVTIDRFESQWAVLETPDGKSLNYPRNLLPKGVKEGDVLDLNIEIDQKATEKRMNNVKGLIEDLKRSDEGGDIQL